MDVWSVDVDVTVCVGICVVVCSAVVVVACSVDIGPAVVAVVFKVTLVATVSTLQCQQVIRKKQLMNHPAILAKNTFLNNCLKIVYYTDANTRENTCQIFLKIL